MNEAGAFLKIYNINDYKELADPDRAEIMRYAGMFRGSAAENISEEEIQNMIDIMEECIAEVMPLLCYKVSFRRDNLVNNGEEIIFPFNIFESKDAVNAVEGCSEIVMFAATIGIGIDRLIAKYSRTSPAKALFLQAIGAERIEAVCNLFNDEVEREAVSNGRSVKRRYSPGYGDLPLEVQKEFMVLLDCSRRIGVNLNSSLLMSPSKSVTAFIGIRDKGECEDGLAMDKKHDCAKCDKTDCEFRRCH